MSQKAIKITITKKAVEQLEALRERTYASSNSEVVRNALRVYNALQEYRDTDGSLIVEKPNGDRIRLVLP